MFQRHDTPQRFRSDHRDLIVAEISGMNKKQNTTLDI